MALNANGGERSTDEVLMVDRITNDLAPVYGSIADEATLRAAVGAEVARWRSAPVQDFVPIFVTRQLKRQSLPARW